jgi:hypothetical protein
LESVGGGGAGGAEVVFSPVEKGGYARNVKACGAAIDVVNSCHSKSPTALTLPWSEVSVDLLAEELLWTCRSIGDLSANDLRIKNSSETL